MSHIAVTIHCAPELTDVLIARLSETGYDGFEERPGLLIAYTGADVFDEAALQALLADHGLEYTKEELQPVNWNAVWESSFEPVLVDRFCGIRAGFHPPFGVALQHEIVITPKMSFGTGHHATTFSMIRLMEELELQGKRVFDFGTGTGILAILAYKMGAAQVDAIDIDEWAVENTRENIAGNQADGIRVWQAGSLEGAEGPYDVLLANINRNILLGAMANLRSLLVPGGLLLLSGIMTQDEPGILNKAGAAGMALQHRVEKDNWLALRLIAS